jgi:ATP phosphoribosyltransferase
VKLGLECADGPPPEPVLELLERSGLPTGALRSAAGPALVDAGEVTWLLAPGADVLEACACGVLDAGVAGKDLLLEFEPPVHELLDLRVCADVLVYATPDPAAAAHRGRPRVATRYPRVTRRHFAATGRQLEVVAFDAAPLAPSLGIADGVVELRSRVVDADANAGSGRVRGLRVREDIAVCSARFVAGRASRILGGERLAALLERLQAALEES